MTRSPRPVNPADVRVTRSGKPRRKRILWRWRRVLFLLGLALAFAVAGAGYVLSRIELPGPPPDSLQTTFVCSVEVPPGQCNESNALAAFHGEEDRVPVPLEKVPEVMQQAVLAAEDRDFFDHSGVDPVGIARAAWADIRNSGVKQGGSTITQQLVKNYYLTKERTLSRKLKEAVMAIKFEQQHSKEEILERYLNNVYFGRGAYGIQAASNAYFGKDVSELDLPEAALLAGLIRAPQRAEPYRYPEEAKRRRKTVLDGMVEMGVISEPEAILADARPFDVFNGLRLWSAGTGVDVLKGADPTRPDYSATPYFVEAVRKELVRRYGADEVFGGGLRVYTTLDMDMQKAAFDAVTTTLNQQGDPEGSLVAVDDQGRVRAMMGGRDFRTSPLNLAMGRAGGGGGRQPGSTFKSFALAEAIRQGYSVKSVFRSPQSMTFPEYRDDDGGPWTVRGGCCGGMTTLDVATARSTNTVYVQLMLELGPDKVVRMANDLGVSAELPAEPSLVLGSGEVSVLDMAAGYSTFANEGVRIAPRLITRVERAGGAVLDDVDVSRQPVLTRDQAAKVSQTLEGVIDGGTGRAADFGAEAAGKTGTTDNNRDAWFVGYTPRLTAAVWMGYPGRPGEVTPAMTSVHGLTVQGGNLPAQIWRKFMERATQGLPPAAFPEPEDYDEGEKINPELSTTRPQPATTVPSTTSEPTTSSTAPAASTEPAPTTSPSDTRPDNGGGDGGGDDGGGDEDALPGPGP